MREKGEWERGDRKVERERGSGLLKPELEKCQHPYIKTESSK